MKAFEYKDTMLPRATRPQFINHLNKMGSEGWELVESKIVDGWDCRFDYQLTWKREMEE